jgi:hypothetical protein
VFKAVQHKHNTTTQQHNNTTSVAQMSDTNVELIVAVQELIVAVQKHEEHVELIVAVQELIVAVQELIVAVQEHEEYDYHYDEKNKENDENKKMLEKLFNKIYNLPVSHILYENQTYYSWTTQWTDRPPHILNDETRTHDPDHECLGIESHFYSEDEDSDEDSEDEDSEDEDSEDEDSEDEDSEDEDSEDEEHEHEYEHEREKIRVRFNQIKVLFKDEEDEEMNPEDDVILTQDVSLVNCCGRNKDHRGSNHCALDLSDLFLDEVFIPKGTYNFYDLARISWQAKGNLFDNNYELAFIDIENININKGGFFIRNFLGHGS